VSNEWYLATHADSLAGKINVDISLNHPDTVSNGVQAAKIIQHYLNDLPGARELILVVKAFLSQRSMNEVYTGGLGSYSVICLVISFIQMHPKLRRSEMDARRNLGTLLCEFFELYGRNFNYDDVGISIRRGGRYYSKRSRGWANFNNQPFLLSIEDPQDSDNDVARSSHGIRQVKMTLSGAYDLLTATMFDRAQRIQDRRARRDRDREQAKKNGGKFSPQPPLDSQETSILATIMGVTKETQKFRRDLADLDASGRLRARVDSLFRRMGSRAVVVSNDGAKAYVRGSATDGGEKRKDKDVEVIVIDDDDAPQVPSRRTPPPAPTRDDGLGAILVDDASDMEMDLASDSMSESESDATDVNDVNDMSFGSASSDDGNAQAWSRGASVSQDSMEDGEIIDSKYATLSRKTKSKKRSKQLSAEQAAVKAEKHDKYLERRRAENERKAAAQAKRKPTAGTAPGKKVAAASDGEAPKASPAKTAGNKAKSAPGSRLPSRATSPSGPARLTADDRKAFWASKGGIIEISDDSE
jgi:non-canonical poly(A) RNA polymerase PAPD5/7